MILFVTQGSFPLHQTLRQYMFSCLIRVVIKVVYDEKIAVYVLSILVKFCAFVQLLLIFDRFFKKLSPTVLVELLGLCEKWDIHIIAFCILTVFGYSYGVILALNIYAINFLTSGIRS